MDVLLGMDTPKPKEMASPLENVVIIGARLGVCLSKFHCVHDNKFDDYSRDALSRYVSLLVTFR